MNNHEKKLLTVFSGVKTNQLTKKYFFQCTPQYTFTMIQYLLGLQALKALVDRIISYQKVFKLRHIFS